MRLCHVITKPELGGAQRTTLDILSMLPKNKYDVSLITSPKGILKSEFEDLENVKSHFSPFLVRPINPLYDIFALIHIYLIYRRSKYDIVHTHSSKAGIIGRWAARLAGIPVIIHTVHGWPFNEYQPRILRRFYIFLEKITARFSAKIICVSRKDLQTGIEYKIAPKEKFVFVKYGIPLSQFRETAVDSSLKKRELKITNNDPIVGMISCLKVQKAPLDYIKAAIKIYEGMPNVNFLLVGDGVLRTKCERFLAPTRLNGRFIFTGWRRDVSKILDILDVVVLTSKWEGTPIAIIEGLSKGCCVVATNVGGTSEIVRDGITGYLTRPGAHEEIVEKVLELLKSPQSLNKMKESASLSIDDSFSVDRMANEIDNVYQHTMENIP